MDLDGVGLVVNYDVPSQAKTYVHRCDGGQVQQDFRARRFVLFLERGRSCVTVFLAEAYSGSSLAACCCDDDLLNSTVCWEFQIAS